MNKAKQNDAAALIEQVNRLTAALEAIRDSPLTDLNYAMKSITLSSNKNYITGVTHGHRDLSEIARKALEEQTQCY